MDSVLWYAVTNYADLRECHVADLNNSSYHDFPIKIIVQRPAKCHQLIGETYCRHTDISDLLLGDKTELMTMITAWQKGGHLSTSMHVPTDF